MKIIRNLLLLVLPFLCIVLINEVSRPTIKEKPFSLYSNTMNSGQKLKNKCSWECHENTSYCKRYHVKLLSPYFSITDRLYCGVIEVLQNEEDEFSFYQIMNVVFLVLVIPLLIWLLLAKSLSIQDQIRQLKAKS
jgi:hypothetical protein